MGEHLSNRKRKIARILVGSVVAILLLILIGMALIVGKMIKEAPDVSDINMGAGSGYETSFVYDQTGETIIGRFESSESRIYVPLEKIPLHLKQEIITMEDSRFYEHNGIDLRSIARAMMNNVQAGSFSEGGTTITGQLVKNNVLTTPRGIKSKIQELYLCVQLEKMYSKDEILEYYLNSIGLGSGTVGVQAAAYAYFGKDVSELTLMESAVLAVIPQRPTYYNPKVNPEHNQEKVKLLLEKMVADGHITEIQRLEALEESVYEKIQQVQSNKSEGVQSYFVDEVYRQVLTDLQEEKGLSRIEATAMIYSGGLQIYSTLDTTLQSIVEGYMDDETLYPDLEVEAAFILQDYETGAIRSIYGGRGEKVALGFNDATQGERQPGTLLKPLVAYAPALEVGGLSSESTLVDEPYSMNIGTADYTVRNCNMSYTYQEMTLKEAFATSNNVIPAKLVNEIVGIEAAYEYLTQFGLTTLTLEDKNPGLAQGGLTNGVTPLEINVAYGTIANGGVYEAPTTYTKILDGLGNVILERRPSVRTKTSESYRVIQKSTAEALTKMLEEAAIRAGSVEIGKEMQSVSAAGIASGKMGSSQQVRDLWFAGYLPKEEEAGTRPTYVATLWTGYENVKTINDIESYYLVLWTKIMNEVARMQ